ncbi:MFS transporter [Streptomyces sp. NPDC057908]|uniref:MFS transporter n=1 Tax=Streptomyces sp. NPDC057908 TaxID=3346276 RepID=UPI0036E143ED
MTRTESMPPRSPADREETRLGGLLRQRDFRLLWMGETTSKLGSAVGEMALPLVAVVTLHVDTFTVGLLTAMAWLPWLLFGLLAGAWIDRVDARAVMILSNGASMVLFLSVPVAAWIDILTVGQLLVVAFLGGTASVCFTTAYRTYLPSLVRKQDLLEANTKLQGSEAAAQVAGPGLGGVVAQAFGAVSGILIDSLTFLFSALCIRGIQPTERRPSKNSRSNLRQEIAAGVRFVLRDPYLRTLMTFGAVSNIALNGFQSLYVVFLVRTVGVDSDAVGVLFGILGVGGVCGALMARRFAARVGTARGMLLCQLCAAPFALLIPMTGPGYELLFMGVGGYCIGVGVVGSGVISVSFRQSYIPSEFLGRVTASMAVINYGAIPIGAVLGGFLGAALGIRNTMWIMTLAFVLACLILVASPIRRLRDFPSAPAAPVQPDVSR